MATAAVSSSSLYQELQTYFQGRNADLQKLGHALQSGDLATAQQEFQTIQQMGQGGPFANGDPFQNGLREKAFEAIGKALQSGDLAGAQQAFGELRASFQRGRHVSFPAQELGGSFTPVASSAGQPVAGTNTTSTSTPEVVLNLGSMTPGEQITIGLSSGQNGGEQLTVDVSAAQGQPMGHLTLNLNPSAQQQIVLNLFNPPASSGQASSVNLSA